MKGDGVGGSGSIKMQALVTGSLQLRVWTSSDIVSYLTYLLIYKSGYGKTINQVSFTCRNRTGDTKSILLFVIFVFKLSGFYSTLIKCCGCPYIIIRYQTNFMISHIRIILHQKAIF